MLDDLHHFRLTFAVSSREWDPLLDSNQSPNTNPENKGLVMVELYLLQKKKKITRTL